MKKKLIFAAVVIALVALALVRYTLIEVNAPLPEDVKSGSAAQTITSTRHKSQNFSMPRHRSLKWIASRRLSFSPLCAVLVSSFMFIVSPPSDGRCVLSMHTRDQFPFAPSPPLSKRSNLS